MPGTFPDAPASSGGSGSTPDFVKLLSFQVTGYTSSTAAQLFTVPAANIITFTGKRFFLTDQIIRDPNGTLTGTANGNNYGMAYNVTKAQGIWITASNGPNRSDGGIYANGLTMPSAANQGMRLSHTGPGGNYVNGCNAVSPGDTLQVGFKAVAAGATATSFWVDLLGLLI